MSNGLNKLKNYMRDYYYGGIMVKMDCKGCYFYHEDRESDCEKVKLFDRFPNKRTAEHIRECQNITEVSLGYYKRLKKLLEEPDKLTSWQKDYIVEKLKTYNFELEA